MGLRGWRPGVLAAALVPLLCGAAAPRPTIFDLPLGSRAAALPTVGFQSFACGSDGGPSLQALGGWTRYEQCAAEPDGLHEVYFEYDDEAEYIARAREDMVAGWSGGTAFANFPIIASALFDEAGTLQALRIVTDPRPEQKGDRFLKLRPRMEHALLGLYLADRFGITPADCHDLPPAPGETPVLGMFTKSVCERSDTAKGEHYWIEQRLLRRPGENDVDPQTGMLTEGQFESLTRAEIRLLPTKSD